MFGNLFGQEDKKREKRAQEAKKRQAEMFARMNAGGANLHSQMAGQAAAHRGAILGQLQRQNDLGTILGMDVQKANARRVSEGRDRQADVIRELIRGETAIKVAQARAEADKARADAEKEAMTQQLVAAGRLKPVTVSDKYGIRREYR